jgi:hypothetical protein
MKLVSIDRLLRVIFDRLIELGQPTDVCFDPMAVTTERRCSM